MHFFFVLETRAEERKKFEEKLFFSRFGRIGWHDIEFYLLAKMLEINFFTKDEFFFGFHGFFPLKVVQNVEKITLQHFSGAGEVRS